MEERPGHSAVLREERLTSIVKWAEQNDDVRVMLLTSSLVNPLAPVDDFSDLDIELVLTDPARYAADDDWLKTFGHPIAILDEADAIFGQRTDVKVVLFEDRGKVDFTLHDVTGFRNKASAPQLPPGWDIGYKVLVDKDGLTKGLKPPTYQASIIRKPSKERFEKLLFDFWWDTTYVAKSLSRGDLFYAKHMSETIIRTQCLVPLIEWYIASQHDWNITTNKHGRLFRKYLSEAEWQLIEKTFSGSGVHENWEALLAMGDVVHEMGVVLGEQLKYIYPDELESRIRAYLLEAKLGERN